MPGQCPCYTPVDQIKNKEEIFLLDSELKRAMAMHSELLSECNGFEEKSRQYGGTGDIKRDSSGCLFPSVS